MKAELKCLDGTTVSVDRDLSGRLDGIELGMIGSMSAPGKGRVRTTVASITPELIVFQELEPEMIDMDPFADPDQIPITAHTYHVGAYEHPTRPIEGLFEVVHIIAMCHFDPEDKGDPIKFTAIVPLENRAACDRMIEEIQRERDRAFPLPPETQP